MKQTKIIPTRFVVDNLKGAINKAEILSLYKSYNTKGHGPIFVYEALTKEYLVDWYVNEFMILFKPFKHHTDDFVVDALYNSEYTLEELWDMEKEHFVDMEMDSKSYDGLEVNSLEN